MRTHLAAAFLFLVVSSPGMSANAGVSTFKFEGANVSGSVTLTYEQSIVPGDASNAQTITGISGTFSDASLGFTNVAIDELVALDKVSPALGDPFPGSLSRLSVTNRNPPEDFVTYTNLFYLGGYAPITCPDYPFSGGYFDVYGLMFKLSNGYIVDIYSNGVMPGAGLTYGAVVIDPNFAVALNDGDGAMVGGVPEPSSCCLVALGIVGTVVMRKRALRR